MRHIFSPLLCGEIVAQSKHIYNVMFSHRRRRKNKRKKNFLSRRVLFRLSLLLSVFCWYWYYSSHHHHHHHREKRVTVNTFKTTTSLRESRQHLNNNFKENNTKEEDKKNSEIKQQKRQLLYPGEAREVCASWSPLPNSPKMTTRKSYWMSERGTLTANELKRKSLCHAKGGPGGSVSSCWQRKLSDVERIRNVGSPSLARLTNETVLAVFRASEDAVGEEGQHLRVTTSRAGEGKGWKVSTPFEEVGKFHNNDWKRGSGMPMWDPIVFAERDGKGRAFVFYAVSDSQRRGECRQEKSVPLLGFGSKPIKPWVRGGDIYVVASTDATLKEWMTPRRVLKSADFNGAPITLNGPAVEMDEANSETGNRDWVVPVCVNGMKQVNVGTVLAQYGRGVHREGGTGEGGFNPKCGAEAVRKCGVIVSSDLGKTWDTSRLHESLGFDRKNGILLADMTVAEIGEGGLYAVFRPKVVVGGEDDGLVVRRTAKSMRLYTAISTDVGKTWTTPREMSSEMRTFDAAARLFRLQPKGPLVLAYNDRSNFDTLEGEDGVSDEENDDDDDESIGSSSGSRSSETSKSSRSGSSSNSASFSDAATNLGALRLTLATSHDHGRTWRKVVTVRDGATTSVGNTNTDESSAFHRQQQQRKTLGLRVSQPWLLQHGCKAFVAFSRDYHALEYSSRFARAQPENDRELGLRVSHVEM